ncbi:carboxypeptidase M32 [Fimbriimonas ginsengisoli]|uniref:Metal-dependent carboxypeptidase n=1 Tax=Fimbriimonas ginsengisoli Gsoil 348 TaxID=661478 RepID=A0A068NY21_FIMGI|nr:carboxypeptidase M32 [Fimbriimonas ginsengisoli]AIE87775.1 carboxypeptidase Taq [Fimbriimonas ginsengisoli Gsoil 348]
MTAYDQLLAKYAEVATIRAAQNLMGWDQQVLMPPGGAAARAAHAQILSRMRHELLTSDEMLRLIADAGRETDPDTNAGRSIAALQRDLDVETKLPVDLVERKAKVSSEAYEVWKTAKAANDFPSMAPYYKELFGIARETAERLGYDGHPYDALLGLYEFGAKEADARSMFDAIKGPIVNLVREIKKIGRPVDDSILAKDWDREKLRGFAERTAAACGFDFDRGRLNLSPNAFCSNLGRSDVRMTTRPSDHLKGIVSSSLHEMGHGLYEQGSPAEWDGTPLAGGISLAVHESQSRLWENVIGRSRGFWTRFLPDLQAVFPELSTLDVERMYRAINKVEPSFIRVGADELTYNLHILVRFELEVDLITGALEMDELPEAWNAKYREYVGIEPPTHTLGCLQDVHWSRGYVGYFPTYAMGNLIGLQIWRRLRDDIPNTEELMAGGDFAPILGWLQEKIYRQGRRYTPRDLITRVTGRPMEAGDWLEYAQAKYRAIYSL